jgi:hypothetical protein
MKRVSENDAMRQRIFASVHFWSMMRATRLKPPAQKKHAEQAKLPLPKPNLI